MNHEQFDIQIQRLSIPFGKKHFDTQRTQMIWGYVSELPYENFIKIVDHMISGGRKPPVPHDFFEAAKAEKRGIQTKSKDQHEIKCQTCQDTGSISAWRRGIEFKHSSTYSFRCPRNCEKANKISSQIQQWTSNFESDFIPCLNPLKSPHEVWKERHFELYGFDESERMPKKPMHMYLQVKIEETVIEAVGQIKSGPTPELLDDEILPF